MIFLIYFIYRGTSVPPPIPLTNPSYTISHTPTLTPPPQSPVLLVPASPQLTVTQQQADQGVTHAGGLNTASGQNRDVGSQGRTQRRKKKPAARGNTASLEAEPISQQQQNQEVTLPRQQQTWCPLCKRKDHTRDQCQKKVCDYCQGRFHSSLTCRLRIADQRQQDLVNAVRQSGQETLLALRSVAWQLHQPPSPRHTGATLLAPHGPSAPQWPASAPTYPVHYGTGPLHYPIPSQAGQQ